MTIEGFDALTGPFDKTSIGAVGWDGNSTLEKVRTLYERMMRNP